MRAARSPLARRARSADRSVQSRVSNRRAWRSDAHRRRQRARGRVRLGRHELVDDAVRSRAASGARSSAQPGDLGEHAREDPAVARAPSTSTCRAGTAAPAAARRRSSPSCDGSGSTRRGAGGSAVSGRACRIHSRPPAKAHSMSCGRAEVRRDRAPCGGESRQLRRGSGRASAPVRRPLGSSRPLVRADHDLGPPVAVLDHAVARVEHGVLGSDEPGDDGLAEPGARVDHRCGRAPPSPDRR